MSHPLIHSLLPYALLTFGLLAALALFLSMKRELRAIAVRNRRQVELLARQIEQAPAATAEPVYIPAAPRAGLNVSKRVQAMRMLRRHQDVSHIAAALGVSRREVELLIRVQEMSAQAAQAARNSATTTAAAN